mgnify:CR=1 FL=1
MLTSSVVLFNTPRMQISRLFKSVFDSKCVETFYIIDNSPNDKWRILEKEYAGAAKAAGTKIRYIHNENLGYGASHNLAMQEAIEAGAKYHVVLNPDVYFDSTVLSELARFMDANEDAAYVLPRVEYPNGELQYLCKLLPTPADLIFRRFLPKSWGVKRNDRYCLKMSGYDKVFNPPCLSGCFMFMRLATLQENDIFFDDGYFMYCEDFDLIRRLHRVARTLYYPGVTIVHDHARESYKSRKMLWAHIKSAVRYFNKWGWVFDKERREMNRRILREIGE